MDVRSKAREIQIQMRYVVVEARSSTDGQRPSKTATRIRSSTKWRLEMGLNHVHVSDLVGYHDSDSSKRSRMRATCRYKANHAIRASKRRQ